jgi:leucyl-tRNA synthetase
VRVIAQENRGFLKVEEKWRHNWANKKIFEADPDKRDKIFVTFPFPYVNGPLHLGHGFTLVRLDVFARFKRMQGFNTLFPMAFHATGEPIIGVAKRLEKGDKSQIKVLMNEGVTETDIKKFKDPKFIARFWQKRIMDDVKMIGGSVDWRRSFMTIDPIFNKFIEWQYRRLKEKGYVIQGTHPVVWCPNCESPTGDHDRLEGEGEGPIEFTLLKFKIDDYYLVAATLRPETIFGQTNMWINPEIEYGKYKVDNKEIWVMSEECAEKLRDQRKGVVEVGKVRGKDLLGKYCRAPIIDRDLMILPSDFCDPKIGSGIVTSVPSHAPSDWMGLYDIQKNRLRAERYGLDFDEIKKIKPISMIEVEGFGEHPAGDICKRMGIESQVEFEKLEKAKKKIYKHEHHAGIMRENCGKYAGMPVEKAKDMVKEDLIKGNHANIIWELTADVVCRCGNTCHVKILENQWFLKFSDQAWKDKVKSCIGKMNIYPNEARKLFLDTVDWLRDKACARKSGLGTRVPWDKDWIIETLSDSVIYMAFYTIRNHLEGVEPDQLKDEVFDYIYLGKGEVEKISKNNSIPKEKLKKMRDEFEYWYGFDMRGSAKELIPNHLTYCLFHHTAIWEDEKKWPKAFTVNGMQQMYGQKMSKSKGNYITIKDAVNEYSADAIRITLMDSGEGLSDPDWTDVETIAWKRKLLSFKKLIEDNYNKGESKEKTFADKWLESRFESNMKKITENIEKTENRSALSTIHEFLNDMQWYIRRSEKMNKSTFNLAAEKLTKVLSPFTPFITEEIWEMMGKDGFVSLSKWPEYDESKIDKETLQMEDNFKKTCPF